MLLEVGFVFLRRMSMFLKRLESIGFKSFAERIQIEFVSGVTAVVGPNGSGKSNIIDAIRWVMGEQSAKSLRGQKMEDIIFQGSESRNPLNYAEVSLILNNEQSKLPIDYQEVNVTRRVYRSGESEFYINKQACRLKDIVDLFMDTGLGRESFSVIGQGKIDEILSSKAEERRAVFEEAAGVLKYKQRKNKAEYKLVETADNLDRVEDIIYEINGQLGPLEKQAETAKQYKKYRALLKETEIALLITEINELHSKWQALITSLEQDQLNEVEERTHLQQKEAAVEKERQQLQGIDDTITSLQQTLLTITERVEQVDGKRNVAIERDKHLQENKQKVHESRSALQKEQKIIQEQIFAEETSLKKVNESLQQLSTKMAQLNNELNHGAEAVEAEVEELKADYIEHLNDRAVLQNEFQSIERRMEQLTKQKEVQQAEHEQSSRTELNVLTEKEKLEGQLTKMETMLQEQEEVIEEQKATIETEQQEYETMRQKLYEGNEQIARLQSRKEMLEEMKDSFQGFFYGVREILQARKANKLQHIYGAVVDLLEVPSTYVTALDTVLGAQAQHVVVPSDEIARETIAWLKKENKGRATFLPLASIEPRMIPNAMLQQISGIDGFIGVASELVQTEEMFQVVARHLLGNVIVVNTLAVANNIAQKTNRRFRIVTLDGDMVYPGGSMSGGAKRKNNQSVFTREKELQTLSDKVTRFRKRATNYTAEVKQRKEKIAELESALSKKEKDKESEQEKFQQLKDSYHSFVMQWKTTKDELSTSQVTMDQLTKEIFELQHERKTITVQQTELNDTISKTEQKMEQLTHSMETMERDERQNNEQIHELDIQTAQQQQSKQNYEEKITSFKQQLNDVKQQLSEANKQLTNIINEENELQSHERLAREVAKLRANRETTEQQLSEKRTRRKQLTQTVVDAEQEIKGLIKVHEQSAKQVQEKEVQVNRLDVTLENLLQTLQTDYVMTYEKACNLYEPVEDAATARETVDQIKLQIKQLGSVNLGAIDEFDRLMERHQFLTAQQTDLIEAKNTLYDVIQEMDKEMTDRFQAVFSDIQTSFTEVFKELFGGGHAELSLTEPQNLLETGIEISARPPGKKLKTLGLLSGGERALTAIALLFAILRVRPVPFCILDEVDAALDETNVERFANFLHDFSEDTQFIVITHRNGTMEEADALYGVTMQESGVSRLVSVKLEETADLVKT